MVGHALRASGQDNFVPPQQDGVHPIPHSQHAGCTGAHNGVPRHFLRDPGFQRRIAGQIGEVRGLAALAEVHLIDLIWGYAGALHAGLHDRYSQIRRRQRLQRTAIFPHRGSASIYNYN